MARKSDKASGAAGRRSGAKGARSPKRTAKKIMRYGKVSGAVAGTAARMAGEKYLGLSKNGRQAHAAELLRVLGTLKGPLMKIGQMLATVPGALPPDYAKAFQDLHSQAPPMGRAFAARRMQTELGQDWEGRFQSFDKNAAAAASLGQVHKAVSHEGRLLACKLQYPDMKTIIAADLAQLKLIFGLYGAYDASLATDQIFEELRDRLYEELDYAQEAQQNRLYKFMLRDEDCVHVPDVIDELCTEKLLTAEWLQGDSILDFERSPQPIRDKIALNLFRAWYVPLYRYGVIHGDPHPGNYTVRSNLDINLLDFGCVRVFPPGFIKGVVDLYHALMRGDRALAVQAFELWGFKGLTKAHIDSLTTWARFLYAPVMEDKIRSIGEMKNGGIYGQDVAAEVHKKLREASRQSGGMRVPREFVLMDRAALGLGSVFLRLGAEVNWHRVFNELIADFNVQTLEKTQNAALKTYKLS